MKSLRKTFTGILTVFFTGIIVLGGIISGLVEGSINGETINPLYTLPPPNLTPLAENSPETELTSSPFFRDRTTPTPIPCVPPDDWVEYTVLPGDSLEIISLNSGGSIEQIIQANCLLSDNLLPSTIIYIPPLVSLLATFTQSSESSLTPTMTQTLSCLRPVGWIEYVIQPGDTLTSISLLFRISITILKDANCLNSDYITAGSTIWVPNVPTSTFTFTPTSVFTITPTFTRTPYPTATYANISKPTSTPNPIP